jgi:hypothetical protein
MTARMTNVSKARMRRDMDSLLKDVSRTVV